MQEQRKVYPASHELATLAEGKLAAARAARDAARPVKPAASVSAAEALLLKREASVASRLRSVEEAETRLVQATTALAEAQARRAEAATALEAARSDALRLDIRAASLETALAAALRQATASRAPDGDGAPALSPSQVADYFLAPPRVAAPSRPTR